MTVYCDYCGHKAALVDDSEIYGRSFGHTAYLCRNCGAYVGCHGRTDKPLGRLADATLRKWKMAAHASFDPLWKTGPFRGRRKAAYGWLAGQMGLPVEKTHIGMFISTHAPAGGATAIFHKSVMRFCGKLPKDDTVLCLASFGFPRRDPKAVYLAWISCANLPQKCVREGLALKDQGTSCFHEGLASHAFDPVLV